MHGMERDRFGRRHGAEGRRRRYWPRSRAAGCLLWVVLLVVLLIVLSVLFGGFQKGTKYKGLAPASHPAAATAIALWA
jgi:cytochrome c-type biogenesis protein CcmH/NrfF